MDWTAIISVIATGALGISAVAVFVKNVIPKVAGWVSLAKDAVETLSDISQALLPDANGKVELTAEEIAKINADVLSFKAQLAVLIAK